MDPKIHKTRKAVTGGQSLQVRDINDTGETFFDDYFEDGDLGFLADETNDVLELQESRIEALKRAIDIAKLMSNVTVDDVINIASKVFDYIKK